MTVLLNEVPQAPYDNGDRTLTEILDEYRARRENIARWEAARDAADDPAMAQYYQNLIDSETEILATLTTTALAAGATPEDLDTIDGEAETTSVESADGGADEGRYILAFLPPTDDWDPFRERSPHQGGKKGSSYREVIFFFHMWIQVNVPPEMRSEFNGAEEVRLEFRPGWLFGQESDHTIEGPDKWMYPTYPPFVWYEPTTPEADAALIRKWQELAEDEGRFGRRYNLVPSNCWTKSIWYAREGNPPMPQPEFMKVMGEALEVHHQVTGGGIFDGGKF